MYQSVFLLLDAIPDTHNLKAVGVNWRTFSAHNQLAPGWERHGWKDVEEQSCSVHGSWEAEQRNSPRDGRARDPIAPKAAPLPPPDTPGASLLICEAFLNPAELTEQD